MEALQKEVAYRKNEAFQILRSYFGEDQIKSLCMKYRRDPPAVLDCKTKLAGMAGADITKAESLAYALLALLLYMDIEIKLSRILASGNSTAEFTMDALAGLMLASSNAALCLMEAGWLPAKPLAAKGKKFTTSNKAKRLDDLGRIMARERKSFISKKKREPTARELFNALTTIETPVLQEIDRKDMVIFWRRANGKEEETSFSSFQDRLTRLKQK